MRWATLLRFWYLQYGNLGLNILSSESNYNRINLPTNACLKDLYIVVLVLRIADSDLMISLIGSKNFGKQEQIPTNNVDDTRNPRIHRDRVPNDDKHTESFPKRGIIEQMLSAVKHTNSIGSIQSYNNDSGSPAGGVAALIPHPGSSHRALHRTLDDVRQQVAQEVAVRTIASAEMADGENFPNVGYLGESNRTKGVRISASLTYSRSDDHSYLHRVVDVIELQLPSSDYLFAIATTGRTEIGANPLIICGSSQDFVQRAILLTSSKFIGRVEAVTSEENRWLALIDDIGTSMYDEDALWDVIRKAARAPIDPLVPPPGSRGVDQILADARSKLQRISPLQAYNELREAPVGAPTFLVDIRPADQREAEGGIHGSLLIERNVLEWRFDPRCGARLSIVDRYDLRVIVFCQEGYTSRLYSFRYRYP